MFLRAVPSLALSLILPLPSNKGSIWRANTPDVKLCRNNSQVDYMKITDTYLKNKTRI